MLRDAFPNASRVIVEEDEDSLVARVDTDVGVKEFREQRRAVHSAVDDLAHRLVIIRGRVTKPIRFYGHETVTSYDPKTWPYSREPEAEREWAASTPETVVGVLAPGMTR